MKALIIITGRGIGGDAVTAVNIGRALSNKGVKCEYALDASAPGLYLKKQGLDWHKIRVPQAGGHAATKVKLAKAGIKAATASVKAVSLIKEINPDVVVGVIGGGAVIACVAAKIAKVPAVGVLITPTDARVCVKLNANIVLPESNLYQQNLDAIPNLYKSYSPINPDVIGGDKEEALKKMPDGYDSEKPTILVSSGSSLFEITAQCIEKIANEFDANILVTGDPLEESYLEYFNHPNIHYLGYINWMHDAYDLADVAVLSDDGVMIHEAIACKVPIVALTGVKYGRYHNMAAVFPGAVIESSPEEINNKIKEAMDNIDSLKEEANKYGEDVLSASSKMADIIINEAKHY